MQASERVYRRRVAISTYIKVADVREGLRASNYHFDVFKRVADIVEDLRGVELPFRRIKEGGFVGCRRER